MDFNLVDRVLQDGLRNRGLGFQNSAQVVAKKEVDFDLKELILLRFRFETSVSSAETGPFNNSRKRNRKGTQQNS